MTCLLPTPSSMGRASLHVRPCIQIDHIPPSFLMVLFFYHLGFAESFIFRLHFFLLLILVVVHCPRLILIDQRWSWDIVGYKQYQYFLFKIYDTKTIIRVAFSFNYDSTHHGTIDVTYNNLSLRNCPTRNPTQQLPTRN